MSIEIIIKVDGIEYEFVPKQAEGDVTESSQNGAETSTIESTDTQSTQTTETLPKE